MGHKKVCLNCKKAFSIYNNESKEINLTCPECKSKMVLVSHRFRPPKQTDTKQWDLAKYLITNGFPYQHIHENYQYVQYPTTMEEAREFVLKFKSQAYLVKD